MSFIKDISGHIQTNVESTVTDKLTSSARAVINTTIDSLADKLVGMPPISTSGIKFEYTLNKGNSYAYYPSDLMNPDGEHKEYIEFSIHGIANELVSKDTTNTQSNKGKTEVLNSDTTNTKDKIGQTPTNNTEEISKTENAKLYEKISTIAMPMPSNGLVDTITNNFGEEQLGNLSGLANIEGGFSLEGLKTAVSGIGEVAKGVGVGVAAGAGGGIGKDILKSQGILVNPRSTAMYNGTSLRTFTFEFDFAPRSESELIASLSIVKAFKMSALSQNGGSRFGGGLAYYPRSFDFKFVSHDSSTTLDYLYSSKRMWCTSFSTDMTPDQVWATFKSGSGPTHFKMTLNFLESEIINRSDIRGKD